MSTEEDSTPRSMVIHLWTCPRSLSTATMYSFGQRPDTVVLDEPLYAYWLQRHPEVFRPYRDELFAAQKSDGNEVLQDLASRSDKPIVFAKHVAKQFPGLDKSLLYHPRARHVFLVRNPMDMILAWERKSDVHKEDCSLETLGLPVMCELYSDIRRNSKVQPIVVDSELLKQFPKQVLTELCAKLEIPFYEEQLKWEAGPKPTMDGLWASYWYDSVHKSTGFDENGGTTNTQYRSFDSEQLSLYREALPFYELLRRKAIGVDPINPGSSNTRLFLGSNAEGATIIDHGIVMNISGTRLADARNEHILAWIGDRLWPRELAKVSVFDSAVQGGDAVWEGLRVYQGKIFKLNEHLQRLVDSSKAMAFQAVPSLDYIRHAIFTTLAANGMRDNVHIRLTLSRGAKVTSSMNPAFNIFGTNLIVLPEWKPVGDMATYDNQKGIKLITATNRRNSAQCVDSKIHHCNLINNILPKIQANVSSAADALMLDLEGFVSETNATNVFMLKDGVVLTPTADSCLPGITRRTVMQLCRSLGIPLEERRISLAEFHAADEVFTTGTMGELTPVNEIDGRQIGDGRYPGPGLRRLQEEYTKLTQGEGVPLPF